MPLPRLALRERFLAHVMVKGSARYERLVRPRKEALFTRAGGDVLEIGAGTGPNLPYLRNVSGYLAAEPNVFMHPTLQEEIGRYSLPGRILAQPAEQVLPTLPEASVDTVICSLVLCSVKDPLGVLAGIRRVLRPGGHLLFLEHVADHQRARRCLQHALSPLFWCLGDGCSPTRPTGDFIRQSGFAAHDMEEFTLPLGPISPHVAGWARR